MSFANLLRCRAFLRFQPIYTLMRRRLLSEIAHQWPANASERWCEEVAMAYIGARYCRRQLARVYAEGMTHQQKVADEEKVIGNLTDTLAQLLAAARRDRDKLNSPTFLHQLEDAYIKRHQARVRRNGFQVDQKKSQAESQDFHTQLIPHSRMLALLFHGKDRQYPYSLVPDPFVHDEAQPA